jgi:hypothetical protein
MAIFLYLASAVVKADEARRETSERGRGMAIAQQHNHRTTDTPCPGSAAEGVTDA